MKSGSIRKMLLLLLFSINGLGAQPEEQEYIRYSVPEMFTYDELVSMSQDKPIEPEIAQKLERMRTTPFLSNEAYYEGVRPGNVDVDGLGKVMRVAVWNAERGVHLEEIILLFTDTDRFIQESQEDRRQAALRNQENQEQEEDQENREVTEQSQDSSVDLEELREDIEILQSADVLVLDEVDWGMPRSDYEEVIVELGKALKMNWVWGLEFVEIDPVVLGLEGFSDVEDPEEQRELLEELVATNKQRLRAMHGTAILSRYPIREAAVRPFEFQPYDWYEEEKMLRPAERAVRIGSTVLGSEMHREMRRGGRTTVLAHLSVPELPEGHLTVVAPHLENRTKPENRLKQMQELLIWIKHIRNPVILAGDLNTTAGDSQALKIEREIYKSLTTADTYVNKGVQYATGIGLAYDALRSGFRFTKNKNDPTAQHVPFFAPNKEQKMFITLRDFRFQDGTAFDFRGDPKRSSNGQGGTLANSNERIAKGFKPTYEWVITVANLGKHKLDWVFVKSYLEDPENKNGPYRFAPHNGETMATINRAFSYFLSDHNPMVVDLPFEEPGSSVRE